MNNLQVLGRSGQQPQAQVMGKADWINFPAVDGTFGEVYFTRREYEVQGRPVVLAALWIGSS